MSVAVAIMAVTAAMPEAIREAVETSAAVATSGVAEILEAGAVISAAAIRAEGTSNRDSGRRLSLVPVRRARLCWTEQHSQCGRHNSISWRVPVMPPQQTSLNAPPDERFWVRYSPHHEFRLST